MTRTLITLFALTLTLTLSAPLGWAENWDNWRGPAWNGSSPETGLPTKIGKDTNVKWKVELPGSSASTPIIHGDRVFVSTVVDKTHKLMAMCFDRKTGKPLWSHEIGVGEPTDNRANKAAPSPTTDGKHVVYFYGTGDLVAFTVDGKPAWRRSITRDYGEFSFLWTFSSSPILYKGKLFLPVMQRDEPVRGRGKRGAESFLLAIDPATGKNVWRIIRPSNARAESLEAFTSMIPYEGAGRSELLVAGGDALTGHDPQTGKELWRWGTWNPSRIGHWRLVPSAVAGGGVVLACAPKGDPVYAVKTGATGDVSRNGGLVWKSEDRNVSSDVATPLYYMGKFYVLNGERKALSCVEPKTGKVVWQREQLGRSIYRASPTGADGKIYTINHAGHVTVFDAKTGDTLHETELGKSGTNLVRPTIAVSQGNVYVKVDGTLYCFGK